MNTDSVKPINLTKSLPSEPLLFDRPTWSPNGDKIAFGGTSRSGEVGYDTSDIVVVGIDGSNPTNLTKGDQEYGDVAPAWSPDGTRIAFSRTNLTHDHGNRPSEIYVVGVDGSNPTSLTKGDPYDEDVAPAWSPDGTRIAFSRRLMGSGGPSRSGPHIFVMEADGSNPTSLTGELENRPFGNPTWSPDGKQIAFDGHGQSGPHSWVVLVMEADGSNPTSLTDVPEYRDEAPAWSPDGTRIAFSRTIFTHDHGNRPSEIYVVGVDGSNPTNLTDLTKEDPATDRSPAWSPDGSRIAFLRKIPQGGRVLGSSDIFVMDVPTVEA